MGIKLRTSENATQICSKPGKAGLSATEWRFYTSYPSNLLLGWYRACLLTCSLWSKHLHARWSAFTAYPPWVHVSSIQPSPQRLSSPMLTNSHPLGWRLTLLRESTAPQPDWEKGANSLPKAFTLRMTLFHCQTHDLWGIWKLTPLWGEERQRNSRRCFSQQRLSIWLVPSWVWTGPTLQISQNVGEDALGDFLSSLRGAEVCAVQFTYSSIVHWGRRPWKLNF